MSADRPTQPPPALPVEPCALRPTVRLAQPSPVDAYLRAQARAAASRVRAVADQDEADRLYAGLTEGQRDEATTARFTARWPDEAALLGVHR